MISFYSIISLGLLYQSGQGQFLQYFYSDLNNHYITPTFNQPQIYYHAQNLYYTQNVNPNIEPAIRTQSKSLLSDHYHGFSYHTAHDNGATSNVVFFRGAINNLPSISNRITVASDILDPQSNIEAQIHKAFEGPHSKTSPDSRENEVSNLSHLVKALLENKLPTSFVAHFHSEGYPANDLTIAANSINNKNNNTVDEETSESKTEIEVKSLADETKINNENTTDTDSSVTDSITTTGDFSVTSTPSAITTTTANLPTNTSKVE